MVYKTNESLIMIQAEAIRPNNTGVVFWSHDRGTAKLRMKLVRKDGISQSLPEGTTVPIRLIFKSATAEGGYGKHDYLATIEDRVNGIVSIVLEDNILGYVGLVEGSVYIDFPDDRSLDTAGRFTFSIKRSPIDDSTPELEDYYFNGFSQTIDKIEQMVSNAKTEIDEKIAKSETQIDTKLKDTNDKITKANQDVTTLNTNIDKANDRIDQTNQQIGDLGQLKRMYSNSIDFGGKGSSLSDFLDAPYYLSKVPLGENIASKSVTFPFTTSNYPIYQGFNIENYKVGQTYTLTMKAVKPGTQSFGVFINGGTVMAGNMLPVEGLTDVWQLTFKITQDHIDSDVTNNLNIYQMPKNTAGACTINWLKIEKGGTRTPNISQFKYVGEGLKDSDDPNDYSWDITPEYAEKSLNNTVSLTEPQSIEGLKNFEDGIQSKGKSVLTSDDMKTAVYALTMSDVPDSTITELTGELVRVNNDVTLRCRVNAPVGTKVVFRVREGYRENIEDVWEIPLTAISQADHKNQVAYYALTEASKREIRLVTVTAGNHFITGGWRTDDSWPTL